MHPIEPQPERTRVLAFLREHGWNATSFQVLEEGFRYWFDPASRGCVAYVDTGGAWVAAGAPIASESDLDTVAREFERAAASAGRRACLFAVESRMIQRAGLRAMPIGTQPVWVPSAWPEKVRTSRGLREQLRRAKAKGVTIRRVPADELAPGSSLRREMDAVASAWLARKKMAPMGFLVDVQLFGFSDERRYLVAERAGAVIGILVAVPIFTRRGWLFEDLLRSPVAPNGTTELLFDAGMKLAAEEHSPFVTLGLAPLSGEVSRWLRVARASSKLLYDFDGVHRFKARLAPDRWDTIYLAWRHRYGGSVALWDSLAAFTVRGGRASFARFGLETVLGSRAIALRVFALMLAAWALVLSWALLRSQAPILWIELVGVALPVLLVGAWVLLRRRKQAPRLSAQRPC